MKSRTLQNLVCGTLRPSKAGNLVSYTLARYWDATSGAPTLNKEFVQCNPDQDRIMQYVNEPCFIYFSRLDIKTALPLPVQSQPGEISFI